MNILCQLTFVALIHLADAMVTRIRSECSRYWNGSLELKTYGNLAIVQPDNTNCRLDHSSTKLS